MSRTQAPTAYRTCHALVTHTTPAANTGSSAEGNCAEAMTHTLVLEDRKTALRRNAEDLVYPQLVYVLRHQNVNRMRMKPIQHNTHLCGPQAPDRGGRVKIARAHFKSAGDDGLFSTLEIYSLFRRLAKENKNWIRTCGAHGTTSIRSAVFHGLKTVGSV